MVVVQSQCNLWFESQTKEKRRGLVLRVVILKSHNKFIGLAEDSK